jgi:predicted nucleic acid-binding protein
VPHGASCAVTDYVVDASAVVKALAYQNAIGEAANQRLTEATCHAPHLVDAEVGHVLRRAERRGEISTETARTLLAALPAVVDRRYPHTGLFAELAWEFRHTITFYDALYVALATVLDLPLLTTDVRLAKAPGLTCAIELIG